jgi:voltage-gated potassium channel
MPATPLAKSPVARLRFTRQVHIVILYARALLIEFRWTLLLLGILVVIGTWLNAITSQDVLHGQAPSLGLSAFSAWMALLAQPQYPQPQPMYLLWVYALYPMFGIVLIVEGIIRLAMLMVSHRTREKKWMLVMASTYRNHVILCGLGHLGLRVLEQLVGSGVEVVVLEKSKSNTFIAIAKEMGVPILLRNMKEDQALIDAGIEHATAIVSCSNDDMANLEVALDARRMNPKIRVVMRMFDQALAGKISGALTVDAAFSSSALAAPVVAAMAMDATVMSTFMIGDEKCLTAEIAVGDGSRLIGKTIIEMEKEFSVRALAHSNGGKKLTAPSSGETKIAGSDKLVVHASAKEFPKIAAAARPA